MLRAPRAQLFVKRCSASLRLYDSLRTRIAHISIIRLHFEEKTCVDAWEGGGASVSIRNSSLHFDDGETRAVLLATGGARAAEG